MAENKQLTSTAQVKAYLSLGEGGDDALLDMIVDGISARMESYCGRTFPSTNRVEFQTPNGSSADLVLDHGPINEIKSATQSGTSTAIASGDLRFLDRTLTLLSSSAPIRWAGGIEVTIDYWAGFKDAIPADLVLAATSQCAFEFQQSSPGQDRLGVVSTTPQEGESDSFAVHDWLPGVRATLDSYRRFN